MLDRVLSRKAFLSGLLAIASPFLIGQQTGITNSTTLGINADFAGTRTDYVPRPPRVDEKRQQVEYAPANNLPVAIRAHLFNFGRVKKYCAAHPDEDWRLSRADGRVLSKGHCPSDLEKGFEAASIFRSRHKDFVAGESNAQVMTNYFESHQLNPREEKSYEVAYKELKKAGRLDLYAR